MHLSQVRRWLLQSPPVEWAILQLRAMLIGALRQGPIPQHVAFVMDGNRRFARSRGIETVEGHNLGFEALARVGLTLAFSNCIVSGCQLDHNSHSPKLSPLLQSSSTSLIPMLTPPNPQILEVCYKSGIKHITIYSFSIENFKRSKHEVDSLMSMAKTKLAQLAQHGDLLERYGACVRVLGRRDLLRPDVLEAMDRTVELTKDNGDAVLNVCFPYTSSDEITTAIRHTVVEFTQPVEESDQGKRGFSERHIKQNIRARHISGTSSLRHEVGASTGTSLGTILEHNPHPREPSPLSTDRGAVISSDTESTSTATTQASDLHSASQPHSEPHSPTTTGSSTNLVSAASEKQPSYPNPETITSATLTKHMFTSASPPLDLLIRTSGVERLSDFMLWQCHEQTRIVFLKCLWPEFDLWGFLPVLVEWQWGERKKEKEGGKLSRSIIT